MNWDVVWSPTAENELAALWLNPALRAAVTRASRLLDQRLERDGANEGESRAGNRRIAFEAPLGITFLVDAAARRLMVTHIWAFQA